MDDKYDANGYGGSDFKRNSQQDDMGNQRHQDGEGSKLNEKADEYLRELLSEKIKIDTTKYPFSSKLLDQEVNRVQTTGRLPPRDQKYVDVYRDKTTKVTVKVLVPIKEYPKFNFMGKLLGPKGNTMKHLQEETMCKMAILGRGSMRDRNKEEELRNSLDPKYAHLTDDLHVEISSMGPPAEAHARIAYALAEVRKYLHPDTNDLMRQPQMHPIIDRPGARPAAPPGRRPPPPRHMQPVPPPGPRPGMPAKSKVISILDRARSAMEDSYSYDDHYAVPEHQVRRAPEPEYYGYESHSQDRYYEDDGYYKEESVGRGEYKPAVTRDVGARRPVPNQRHFARASPYTRRAK